MNTTATKLDLSSANPHALATILEASETKLIIAARDIFDLKGIKLWARNQPVSQDLQRKLLDRQLSQPLETSLVMDDGITNRKLVEAVQSLLLQDGHLAPLLRPHALVLQKSCATLWLHPVAQLLLSAEQTAHPRAFAHAVEAMAVAGALACARGAQDKQVTQAMTAGLLHDIGEMYLSPEHGEAEAGGTLDVDTYRQLVVHPHVGQLLLSQLTDYPKDVIRAVGEHHEHLDGSGYPHCLRGDQISPLGQLLSATEAALLALREPGATLHHASVALRVVPGEFDDRVAGPISVAARQLPPLQAHHRLDELLDTLTEIDTVLQLSLGRLDTVGDPEHSTEGLQRAVLTARHLLGKLRHGWNESGLWHPGSFGEEQAAELEAVEDALVARLRFIERVVRLTAGDLPAEEADQLDALCEGWALNGA